MVKVVLPQLRGLAPHDPESQVVPFVVDLLDVEAYCGYSLFEAAVTQLEEKRGFAGVVEAKEKDSLLETFLLLGDRESRLLHEAHVASHPSLPFRIIQLLIIYNRRHYIKDEFSAEKPITRGFQGTTGLPRSSVSANSKLAASRTGRFIP